MKPGIPPVGDPAGFGKILQAMKDHLEILGGSRTQPLDKLATTATLPEVIAKLNALLDRVNVK